ncbi:hypothetical protein Tco_0212932, partial [Tanacetum coccineum]
AGTMLVDSKLPTTFWAEVVNTASYVLNRVLVIKPHTKTSYKLIDRLHETLWVSCYHLKYQGSFRIVEETLNIRFLENTPNVTANGPDWLFDVNSLTISMNYVPIVARNQTNSIAGTRDNIVTGQPEKKTKPKQEYILIPICTTDPLISQGSKDSEEDSRMKPTEVDVNGALDKDGEDDQATRILLDHLLPMMIHHHQLILLKLLMHLRNIYLKDFLLLKNAFTLPPVSNVTPMDDTKIFGNAYDDEDVGAEADLNNLETTINVSPIPTTRIDKDHPKDQIIRDFNSDIQTRRITKISDEHAMRSIVYQPPGFERTIFSNKVYKNQQEREHNQQKHNQQERYLNYQQERTSLTAETTLSHETIYKEWKDKMERAATTASSLDAEQDSDETVYKEWEDRMERAATTASSLDAEQDSDAQTRFETTFKKSNDPPLSRGYTLGSGEDSMKLLELMELCTNDADGISSLPNTKIFKQLALMGYASNYDKVTFQRGRFFPQWRFLIHTILHCLSPKKTAWEQFSSNIATAIICLATNRTFNFSKMIFEGMKLLLPHKRTYVAPTLTQKLLSNMRRISKGYNGVDILLFSSMIVQGPIQQGEGSIILVESHHTPITTPSTSQPPLSSPSRVPTPPHDSPLPRGHTPGSDEGRMQQTELMDLVIKLSGKVLALETDLQQIKKVYSTAVTKLIIKVKRLEKIVKSSKARRRAKIIVSDDEKVLDVSSKQRRMIDDIDQDAGFTLVTPTKTSTQEDHPEDQLGVLSATKVLTDVARVHTYSRRRRTVSTSSGEVSTASRIISTAEETISIAGASMPVSTAGLVQEITSSSRASKDKGKAVIIEYEPGQTVSKLKERQERAGYEATIKLQEQLDQEESQRIGFTKDEWENIRARVEANEELTQQLQAKEREKYSEVDQAKMLQRTYMSNYIKNQEGGYLIKQLKSLSFEEVKEICETTMRRVHSFVPMDFELEVQRLKRAGQEVLEELAKRQNIGEASVEEIYIEALHVKYPIIDWEIFTKESRSYWRIIRVGNHTEVYQSFEDMLKRFDRDDLEKLWDLDDVI